MDFNTVRGLLLAVAALCASPAWAVNEHTEQAVSAYLNTTLPTIAKLKPYINRSASERARALGATGVKADACEAATTESIYASEHFAEGAGNLCQAMIAWLENEDIFTCSRVKFSGIDFAHTEPVDARIAARHKADKVLDVRLQLQKAANCTGKTVSYWGPRLLGLVDQLSASVSNAGELLAPPGGVAPTAKAFEYTVFLCHLAYNGDEKTKSSVVSAADDACYAMNYLLDKKVVDACRTLDGAITKAGSMGASDPLAREAKGLTQKLAQRFGSLNCGTVIAEAKVADDAAKAKQAAATPAPAAPSQPAPDPYAKRNAIIQQINGEQIALTNVYEVAQRWFDRGEDGEACGYYQKALTGWRALANLYSDLNRETGDGSYITRSNEMKEEASALLEDRGDMCQEAGKRLY